MSFVDLRFLIFFPVVVALNFLFPARFRWVILLIASYVFYMAWKPEYGFILLSITAVDFVAGLMIERTTVHSKRKAWLLASLVANLGLLFTFKYFDFLFSSINELFRAFGTGASLPLLGLVLPIGISFHVFQSISYTIDVYMERVKAVSHFGKFALYVSFFPQLVAGPIERPSTLLPQFFEERRFDPNLAQNGTLLIVWGFFKKLVIADNLAPAVNAAFASPDSFSGPSLILATLFFAYQIYCDFSGYTDIARGAANILGYRLVKNFNRPYAARSVSEFWRRWHISLSTWFRDYVYIPLGGSQSSQSRVIVNLMITFILSGLWHGANLTYMVWGGLNGLYLVIGRWKPSFMLPAPLQALWDQISTFVLICFAWVFFRATSVPAALHIIGRFPVDIEAFFRSLIAAPGWLHSVALDQDESALACALISIVFMEWVEWMNARGIKIQNLNGLSRPVRFALYSVFGATILAAGSWGATHQFIYFQF